MCTQPPPLTRLSVYPPWAFLHPPVYQSSLGYPLTSSLSILLGLSSNLQNINPPWSFLHSPVFQTPLSSLPIFFGYPPPSNQKILLGCPPIHLCSSLYTNPLCTILHHPIFHSSSDNPSPSNPSTSFGYPPPSSINPSRAISSPPFLLIILGLSNPLLSPGCLSSLGYPPVPRRLYFPALQ